MHRTLKAETTRPAANTFQGQQRKFNRFIEECIQERPHEALGMLTPASYDIASSRMMPRTIAPFEYPDHFEVRYVSASVGIRWNHRWVNVSQTCKGQYLGLEEIEENVWDVFYGPIKLVRFHEDKMRIEDEHGRLERQRRKTRKVLPRCLDDFASQVPGHSPKGAVNNTAAVPTKRPLGGVALQEAVNSTSSVNQIVGGSLTPARCIADIRSSEFMKADAAPPEAKQ
jgi:hypothetical protein